MEPLCRYRPPDDHESFHHPAGLLRSLAMLDRAQITVRLDADLRRRFQLLAVAENTSMQALLLSWISIYVRRQEDNAKRD